jgi:hypothetical protein
MGKAPGVSCWRRIPAKEWLAHEINDDTRHLQSVRVSSGPWGLLRVPLTPCLPCRRGRAVCRVRAVRVLPLGCPHPGPLQVSTLRLPVAASRLMLMHGRLTWAHVPHFYGNERPCTSLPSGETSHLPATVLTAPAKETTTWRQQSGARSNCARPRGVGRASRRPPAAERSSDNRRTGQRALLRDEEAATWRQQSRSKTSCATPLWGGQC